MNIFWLIFSSSYTVYLWSHKYACSTHAYLLILQHCSYEGKQRKIRKMFDCQIKCSQIVAVSVHKEGRLFHCIDSTPKLNTNMMMPRLLLILFIATYYYISYFCGLNAPTHFSNQGLCLLYYWTSSNMYYYIA